MTGTPQGAATAAPRPRQFKTRHLTMMALGSAIGAGFFLGTGQSISQAGPAVLISYLLASFIAIAVMYALAELASAMPSTGSFSTYAEAGIGKWAGFTAGWMYWFTLIMVLGMEITGSAEIVAKWFPGVPQWSVALVIVVVFGGINLLAAGAFGEVEAWLAGIKVFAIIAFLVIGLLLIAGVIPGREESVAQNILGHGGFMPKGLAGIAVGLLAIITSFGGIEIVTIAAAESEDAQTAMSKAIRSVIWRILVFYMGSVAVLICLLPWNSDAMRTVPFAAVLDMAGIPAVGRIMEAVVLVALVSAFSANIYASSRMAYSLSARGMGSRWLLGRTSAGADEVSAILADDGTAGKAGASSDVPVVEATHDVWMGSPADGSVDGLGGPGPEEEIDGLAAVLAEESADDGDIAQGRTPKRAVWVSIVLALVSVALNWLLPEALLGILINAIGMSLLIVWVFIVVSQIRLHGVLDKSGRLGIRAPGWPWLPWVVLVAFVGMAGLMAWSPAARPQLLAMLALTVVIIGIYWLRVVLARRADARAAAAAGRHSG